MHFNIQSLLSFSLVFFFLFFVFFCFFAKRCGSTCVLAYAWLRAWMSTTMRRQRRHSAMLPEECFIVHNGGNEEYGDVMSEMEIYTGIELMSCDALNLLKCSLNLNALATLHHMAFQSKNCIAKHYLHGYYFCVNSQSRRDMKIMVSPRKSVIRITAQEIENHEK